MTSPSPEFLSWDLNESQSPHVEEGGTSCFDILHPLPLPFLHGFAFDVNMSPEYIIVFVLIDNNGLAIHRMFINF